MFQENNTLQAIRGFAIKSNLNKIIALLFINWKLVRFYRYLIVLQEIHNAGEIFRGMEIYHCELRFKIKMEEGACLFQCYGRGSSK